MKSQTKKIVPSPLTLAVGRALRRAAKTARLLIENNAGLGGCVGAKFEEIKSILDQKAVSVS